MRGGPDGMNVDTVERATWAVARVLRERCLGGSTVVVGRDARHNSDDFALATAEVFAAAGFDVVLLPDALPTPVVAFAVRRLRAAAGVQITASHNPAADNGYKVYFDGGVQIISPIDREIEAAMRRAPQLIPREIVQPSDTGLVELYMDRAAGVRRTAEPVRAALTPMHGVGGTVALEVLRRAGITDVHTVASQFWPDPDFPTVAFPNPEEPGATDAVLALAADVDADIAIALDPDADRCAVGIPTESGWRMLSGDETGWLLGDYILSTTQTPASEVPTVASTVVSSRMLGCIAAAHGARHVETLTGFKWLARAAEESLVYAYEEAIGHCVDPSAVRDKDGVSAAVLACDLVSTLKMNGRTVIGALDDLARQHGVHQTAAATERVTDAAAVMTRLRTRPPSQLAGIDVSVDDLQDRRGAQRTDALILRGESVRVAIRPSGTEPKIKGYLEVALAPRQDLPAAQAQAATLLAALTTEVSALLTGM
ncbi:phosphomannomutase [Mycobacterium sp. MS1601]|uniref:phospho-sugar mutase n=1 Tax=Mycobacterium sp. MS1601 TaxID=1936029 RepID=UPI00097965A4|nr:phospho-sugar mutase [Mycobacterium sp. MS1601]AQA06084.1 phosphomannomutase [Mycobacterium sp. MS1601]